MNQNKHTPIKKTLKGLQKKWGKSSSSKSTSQQQQRLFHITTKPPALRTEERGFPYAGLHSSSRCGSSSENTKIPVMAVNLWLVSANTFGEHSHGAHWALAPGVSLDVASTPQTWTCSQLCCSQLGCCVPRFAGTQLGCAPSLQREFCLFVHLQPHETVKLLLPEVPTWPRL